MLAEIQSLVGDDSSAASGDAAHQHKPLRPSNGPPWPRSSAAIGGSYTVGNSFSPPQSSLTSSRTSIEAEGSLLSSETKRPTPPANHAVARQVSNVTHKPSILSTLSTAVSSSHASQEIERDAQQRAPAPDTAVIGCIDYATNGALEKTQGSDGGVTALPTAISSPATSFGSSPTLVSSPTPSLVSRRPSHKESSLRQRLFKGSKPKTPMASPKSSYEALSQPQLASGPAQGPKPTAISLQNPAQPPASTVGSSPKSSLLELSLFQDTPQPLQQPVSRTTSRKSSLRSPQVPPTEKLHSPLRIQGRAKSPHPSPRPASKPASSTHARQPSTQSKRTTRSVASKISKISKPRSRSQSRSRRSSSSRQQNNGDNGGPLDWSYQLKEATASKESLRIKRAQEVERKAMVEKLGMRPVRVAKGGFWRRTFGRR